MKDFYDFVYGPHSKLATINGQFVVTHPQHFVEAMERITGTRETLNDIINAYIKDLEEKHPEKLDPSFKRMAEIEQRLSRAINLRMVAMLMNSKFSAFQKAYKTFANSYRTGTGKEPERDSVPSYRSDRACAAIEEDIRKCFGYMNFLIHHSLEKDEPFLDAVSKMKTMSKSLTGNGQIGNIDTFEKEFAGIFLPIIAASNKEFSPLFNEFLKEARSGRSS